MADQIPALPQTAKTYLNRTTVIYGPAGSGKTTLANRIRELLKPHVGSEIIVAPTAGYDQKPGPAPAAEPVTQILKTPMFSEEGGVREFLQRVGGRQRILANIAAKANNLDILQSLYAKCRTEESDAVLDNTNLVLEKAQLDEETERTIKRWRLKSLIRANRERVFVAELSQDERCALEHLDLKHHLLLIFDDCASYLKAHFDTEYFRRLFYQNRHLGVTTIVCCQDDTDISLNLRKNAQQTIYLDREVALGAINRLSELTRPTKERARDICSELFAGSTYAQLVYKRWDEQTFYRID